MATQIKITQLTDIGSANLAVTTLLPVVNMAGVPTTQKTTLGNLANVILSQSGGNYAAVGTANIAYSVANAAQPNITSVGTLTNLAVSGNATVNGNITSNGTAYVGNLSTTGLASITTLAVGTTANLGAVGNVKITGGTGGYVLQTDGTGNLSWTAQTGGGNGVPGGSNTQVQFNDAGSFGGNTGFTFNKTTGVFTSPFLAGNGNGLSNIQGANVSGTVGNANLSQYLDVSDVNNNFSYHVVLSAGAGDKSLHIDADDNLQYNPADGTLTATRVDATYVLADLQFSNGYPAANVTGLGNIATLNLDGNVSNLLTGNGTYVAIPVVPTVGNIATINLDGSNSNVLYGNGVFAAVAGGANTGNVTFDDVTIQGDNSQLELSAGPDFTANLAYVRVRSGDVASHIHLDTGNNEAYDLIVGDDQKFVQVSSTGNIIMSSYDGNASYTWTLDTTGNLTLPLGSIVYETNIPDGALSGSAIALKPTGGTTANQQLLIYPTANDGDHIHMTSGNLYETELFLGSDNFYVKLANTGNVIINSNDGNSSNAMWTFGTDGTTTFPTGNITSNTSLQFTTTFANVKTVEYQTAGIWDLYVEDSITGSNTASSRLNVSFKDNLIDKPQVYIENTKESDGIALRWTFDENGTLNFPRDVAGNTDPILTIVGGANPSISAIDASLAGPANLGISALNTIFTGFTGDAIKIYPDDGEISSTANLQIWANSGGNTEYSWTFDTTGNLTLPQGSIITNNIPPVTFDILFQYDDLVWAGNTLTFTNASSTYMLGVLALMEVGDTIILGSTSTTVTGVYTGGGAGTFTVNGTGVGQQIAQFTLPNRLTSVNGIKLTTNAKNYLFTEVGVTQSPVLTVDTLPSGQYAVAGFRAFVSDANLAPVGNFGAIVGNSGSNTVCVWCDGTNWRIG